MEYTTNYHLPQWVESDRILMGDFNQMCADIEAGLTEAKTVADSAQEAAETLPFVTGTYSGNGSTQTITLGFRPSLVIIYQQVGGYTEDELGGNHFMVSNGTLYTDKIAFTSTGFTVGVSSSIPYPCVNGKPFVYSYIAFQ